MGHTPRIPVAMQRDPQDILQALGHTPELLTAWLDTYDRIWTSGTVDHDVMELVRIRVAKASGCGY